MKKINGGYRSLFEFLVTRKFPLARTISEKLYPVEHRAREQLKTRPYGIRYNETPRGFWNDYFIGSLQPIASMAHDVQYTFKPYKSFRDLFMDIAQPLRGLGNLTRGIAMVVAAPLFLAGITVKEAFTSGSFKTFLFRTRFHLGLATAWLIDGLSSIVRGATQVIATPLTWGLRIPIRVIYLGALGVPDIKENEEIQHLVDQGEEALENDDGFSMDCISLRLHEEYQKSVSRWQRSEIDSDKEQGAFEGINIQSRQASWTRNLQVYPQYSVSDQNQSRAYLNLFRKHEAIAADDQLPLAQASLN